MKIERPALVAEFSAFEREGNGVVIGAPGVGKSHLLALHFRSAVQRGRRGLLLQLDRYPIRNDLELRTSFGLDRDLLDILRDDEGASASSPGLLVFDSYDALRSEESQRYVLNLLRRLQTVLQDRWRVVVSVRTFDASRSSALLDLFPDTVLPPEGMYRLPTVRCRHFFIPLLSESEAASAAESVAGLGPLYQRGTREFHQLLRVPFHLWLVERLLLGGVSAGALSQVSSEVQLLDYFWQQRVASGTLALPRHRLLTAITRAMVEQRQLSLRIEAHYLPADDGVWTDLLSSEVLVTPDTARQRVSYAHNILFDFAVSVLLIEDAPEAIAAFLAEEPARPVFLRPSIDYHFTRLWFARRDAFWAATWLLITSSEVHLRLFGRLIPMAVIMREAHATGDLAPILERLHLGAAGASDAVLRLMQARRAISPPSKDLWLAALDLFAEVLDKRFAWDLTVQTYELLDGGSTADELRTAGRIARRVFAWVWSARAATPWADSLGSSWACRLLVRTYCTDPAASRALLRPVLDSGADQPLAIPYLTRLVADIDRIWPCDPEFVASVYVFVLGHIETSTEATPMGTPVLPMNSNRRQDFEMCIYQLARKYPDFLAADEVSGLTAGIDGLNAYVERHEIVPYLVDGSTTADLTVTFPYRGARATYVRDKSEIWRASGHQDQAFDIAASAFRLLDKASERDSAAVAALLDVFAERARMAFWWAGLLEVGARRPDVFAPLLFELCVAEPVLSFGSTLKQVTDFIGAAYPYWRPEQRQAVERAILGLGHEDDDAERVGLRRQRLLGQVSPDLLVTADARGIRDEMTRTGRVPTNEPLFRFTAGTMPYGEEEWLREQGADPSRPVNLRLREESKPLDAFEAAWRNTAPPDDAVVAVLPLLARRDELLGAEGADPAVVEMVRTRLATAAKLAARTATPAKPGFDLIRATLLEAAQHHFAEPANERDVDADFISWSSRPGTEAAQGLPWIALRQPDPEVLSAIERLSRTPDAIVRYLTVTAIFRISGVAPGHFWSIIDERISHDASSAVRLAVCESLARIAHQEPARVANAARRLWALLANDKSKRGELRSVLLDIVIFLTVERDDNWARSALDELARTPFGSPQLLQTAVLKLWNWATPSRLVANRTAFDVATTLASTAVAETCRVLRQRDRTKDAENVEVLKILYGVIDETVSHAYFCISSEHNRDTDSTPEGRREFFYAVAPVLDSILEFGLADGFVFAPTVHQLMELLNTVVDFDARRAVKMASRAARVGESSNYNIDAVAVDEVVKLVERVLADHRSEVQDSETLEALMSLLDIFAETGWPQAIQLVWRLDDLFR